MKSWTSRSSVVRNRTYSPTSSRNTRRPGYNLGALAFEGSLTTLGYSASRQTTIDVTNLIVPQASIRSLNMFAQPKAAVAEAWSVIVSLLKSGAIKPIVAKRFPLTEAAEALRYLIEGRPFGRVILTI